VSVAAPVLRVFREYVDKASVQAEVTDAFFNGIEMLAGIDCRRRCEDGGLSTLLIELRTEIAARHDS